MPRGHNGSRNLSKEAAWSNIFWQMRVKTDVKSHLCKRVSWTQLRWDFCEERKSDVGASTVVCHV